MADLLFEHVGHTVRGRPHALANLGLGVQTAGQADVDVPVFVGTDPVLSLHVALANERASFHRCVDFVAGAVEEAGVDEYHSALDRPDAFLEVHGGATFFVHQAELDSVRSEAQDLFDSGEDLVGEGGFVGSVHLRLHHVDRTASGVLVAIGLVEIVFGAQHGQHCIEQTLGNLVAIDIEHSRCGHQMANVAHQHGGPPSKHETATLGRGVEPIVVHTTGET